MGTGFFVARERRLANPVFGFPILPERDVRSACAAGLSVADRAIWYDPYSTSRI
jgi:hypothetical protein